MSRVPDLPRSALLASWGGAVLRGATSPDAALDAVIGDDTSHCVVGVPGTDGDVGLAIALGRLRTLGATGLALVLPVPGDPSGLPGPPAFNAEAVAAGEAVLVQGVALGMVPTVARSGSSLVQVTWKCAETLSDGVRALPSLSEADRELKEGLAEATTELIRMDVARWRPEAMGELARARARLEEPVLPRDFPQRAERVLVSARTVAAIVAVASPDPGAAVSAGAIAMRGEVLTRLSATSRRAIVAAVNAPLEPQRY